MSDSTETVIPQQNDGAPVPNIPPATGMVYTNDKDVPPIPTGQNPTPPQDNNPPTPPKDGDTPDGDVFEKTGDPLIDEGIALLIKTDNLTHDDVIRAIGTACERQDPTLIDKAFVKERFGDKYDYVMAFATKYVQNGVDSIAKSNAAIYELAGGEDNWSTVRDIFLRNAPDDLKKAAKALADTADEITAAKLMLNYANSTGLVQTKNTTFKGSPNASTAPLSAAEFKAEVFKLQQDAGNHSLGSPKYQALMDDLTNRRRAGIRLNI